MSESDVYKMKVADLKRELKLRSLPITGNKTELQERLQTALLDGDLSLEDTAISEEGLLDEDVLTDEEVADAEATLSPLSEEKVLLSTPTTTINSTISTTSVESKPAEMPQPKKVVILKRKSITLASESANDGSLPVANDQPSEKITKIEFNEDKTPNSNDNPVDESGDKKVSKLNQLSAQERMEMRAKKFGLKDANTTSTTDSKEKITAPSNDPKVIEALKKRAERFGVVTAPQIAEIEKAEKLQKRRERFGGSDVKSDNKNSSGVYAEKARLRLERFKTTATN